MVHPQIVQTFERFNVVCGIVFNCFLLYLIHKFSRPNLSTYKILLYVFAIYDIFICIVHGVIDHHVIILDTMFIAVSKSFGGSSRALTAFFCAFSTVPFALVIINFMYRYWAVQYPERIRLFSSKSFGCLLTIICFLAAASWYFTVFFGCTGDEDSDSKTRARLAYRKQYGEIAREGYVLMEHWNDGKFNLRSALVLLYLDSMIIGCIVIAYSLALWIFRCIRSADRMSGYKRKQQGRLLIALCAQTAVPVISVYIPYFIVLTSPFFGLSINELTRFMVILNSCFPSVDAGVIIVLMTDYRNGLTSVLLSAVGVGDSAISSVKVISVKRTMYLS